MGRRAPRVGGRLSASNGRIGARHLLSFRARGCSVRSRPTYAPWASPTHAPTAAPKLLGPVHTMALTHGLPRRTPAAHARRRRGIYSWLRREVTRLLTSSRSDAPERTGPRSEVASGEDGVGARHRTALTRRTAHRPTQPPDCGVYFFSRVYTELLSIHVATTTLLACAQRATA